MNVKVRTSTSNARLRLSLDVGGTVGEAIALEVPLSRDRDVEQAIAFDAAGFQQINWETNGGQLIIQAINAPIDIYDIKYYIARVHNRVQ